MASRSLITALPVAVQDAVRRGRITEVTSEDDAQTYTRVFVPAGVARVDVADRVLYVEAALSALRPVRTLPRLWISDAAFDTVFESEDDGAGAVRALLQPARLQVVRPPATRG